jgi:amino acid transporter
VYAIILLGASGISVANAVVYAVGPQAAWLSGNRVYMAATTGALLGGLIVVSILGLRLTKWIHNGASVLMMMAFALLIALPFINMARGTLREYHPFAITAPALTLLSVNIFGKLAVGALSGFEYVAVLAGESRDPRRTIGLSVIIAAPIIALMFILGTSVIQAIVPMDQIDLVGPIPQAFRVGLGSLGAAALIVPFAVAAIASRLVANSSVIFTTTTRMPMVAGWDNLMPAWFTKLHPRYKTPVNSVFFIGGCALLFALLGMTNVGEQEAFQLLDNAAGILYGLTYLVLFAIPLIGFRGGEEQAPLWLRIAAAAGFATTVLYIFLSVLPIVDVQSRLSFALKISAVVVGANILGVMMYYGERLRGRRTAT